MHPGYLENNKLINKRLLYQPYIDTNKLGSHHNIDVNLFEPWLVVLWILKHFLNFLSISN